LGCSHSGKYEQQYSLVILQKQIVLFLSGN
jgi:hypothetical protein